MQKRQKQNMLEMALAQRKNLVQTVTRTGTKRTRSSLSTKLLKKFKKLTKNFIVEINFVLLFVFLFVV